MKRLLATTAVALCLGGTVAHAEMSAISTTAYWRASGGINNDGYPMCMVQTAGTANDGSAIGFMIKYDTHYPDQFSWQLYKQDWNIPPNQRVRVALKIDNAPGRIFVATQGRRRDLIDFAIQNEANDPQTGEPQLTYLFNLLRWGKQLRISFPDGNELDWGAPLQGANQEIGAMSECIRYLARQAESRPSQPYSQGNQSATPRQQLPATQRTTQPYTPL